jgi:hypothetical protein
MNEDHIHYITLSLFEAMQCNHRGQNKTGHEGLLAF